MCHKAAKYSRRTSKFNDVDKHLHNSGDRHDHAAAAAAAGVRNVHGTRRDEGDLPYSECKVADDEMVEEGDKDPSVQGTERPW